MFLTRIDSCQIILRFNTEKQPVHQNYITKSNVFESDYFMKC